MPDDNKTNKFLQKLVPCIDRRELEKCVEEAVHVAGETGMGAEELLNLSTSKGMEGIHDFAYVIALAAAQGFEGTAKAGAYYNAGLAAGFLGNKEKQEEQYKQAIAADPKYAATHYNYAILLKELKRNEEAEKHYQLAIEANPKYAAAHYNYANLLRELKRNEEAEKHYQLAIEANPNLAEAHYNYANLLKELKRNEEAEKHYQLAIEANPNLAEAHGAYGLLLIDFDKRKEAWKETDQASDLFKENERIIESHLAKAWFYQRYSENYIESNKYRESSDDAFKAGEEYLKAAESIEGEMKYALELRGNEFKAKSFIRRPHKDIYELIDNLKEAAAFYKNASICPVSGKQDVCSACHSVITVLSLVLEALDNVVNDERHSIKREEWTQALKLPHQVYLKNKSKKGAALVVALNQLIRCVDELADYKARRSSVQEKRLKDCYDNLLEVSSKVEGGLKNITDPASDIIKDYARKKGIPISDEKMPEVPPLYLRLIKPIIGATIVIILGIIANRLFSLNLDLKIINFIKSLLS